MKRKTSTRARKARQAAQGASLEYRAALDAVALARRNPGLTLKQAAELAGTTVGSVQRYAGPALTTRRGRLIVKAHDSLPRRMRFLTGRGHVSVLTTDSRDATVIADYNNAIRKALPPYNDISDLKQFEGYYFASEGRRYDFVTDPKTINRLERAGAIEFLDIYASDGGK